MIKKLFKKILFRLKKKDPKSYSFYLSNKKGLLKRKIVEECIEYLFELKNNNSNRITSEFCDLIYHLVLALVVYKVKINKVFYKLFSR